MSIYKELLASNIKSSRSNLNQLVDVLQEDISASVSRRAYAAFVTGGIGPGITSSLYQTVYDSDFTLQTANATFDVTIGLNPEGDTVASAQTGTDTVGKELFASSSVQMREKMDNYRQFAGALLGDTSEVFTAPYGSTSTSAQIDAAMFIAFKRLFARDQIKRETFAMRFFTTASAVRKDSAGVNLDMPPISPLGNPHNRFNENLYRTSTSGSTIYTDIGAASNKLVAFGGQVGNIVNASNTSEYVGLMFYDRGIAVFDLKKITSASQFMSGVIDAMHPLGAATLGAVGTQTALSCTFIPDFIVSASIDNIVDHLCYTRFGSGSQTAITFQNVTNINSTLIFCSLGADEFNYSSNPTYIDSDNRIRVIEVGAEDTQQSFTYVTTVGLYDAQDNLLAVAKMSRPIEKSPERQLTIRLRIDFAKKKSFRYTK